MYYSKVSDILSGSYKITNAYHYKKNNIDTCTCY